MNSEQFKKITEKFIEDTLLIMTGKGEEYAGTEDRFANFRRGAQNLGISKEAVLLTYAAKHWDSICQWVRTGCGKDRPSGEPIRGRIADLVNYLLLLNAMASENEKNFDTIKFPMDFKYSTDATEWMKMHGLDYSVVEIRATVDGVRVDLKGGK